MAAARRMRPALGTFVEIGMDDGPAGALDAAFGAIDAAQACWSFQDPDSELSRLNRRPGERVPVGRATLRLLMLARMLARRSDGLFDPTVGGDLVLRGILPDHGGTAPLARGSADDIELGTDWVRLRRPVRLTLDGIAKGWAVDRAVGALRRAGATGGWVNAGGDLRVFGSATLDVRRREADGSLRSLGILRNGALATSRSGAPDPDFPGVLVGPADAPAQAGVWSVLAMSAARADALTKVAAAASPSVRAGLLARLGGHLVDTEGAP